MENFDARFAVAKVSRTRKRFDNFDLPLRRSRLDEQS